MGKKKKNVYDVDMNGIYKKGLETVLSFINDYLLKKYDRLYMIERILNECDTNCDGIRHLLNYLEYNDKNIFTIRREPNNKSKLWNHITNYTLDINTGISLFD